jgi:hypothetical protein
LLPLIREFHWRPVIAGVCLHLAAYPWTSHRQYSALRASSWMSLQPAFRLLGPQPDAYKRFIRSKPKLSELERARGPGEIDPRVLGSRAFLAALPVRARYRSFQTFDSLARSVALSLGLDVPALAAPGRAHTVVLARAVLVWHCVHRRVATLSECARQLGRNKRTLQRAIARHRQMYPQYFSFEHMPDAAPILPAPLH